MYGYSNEVDKNYCRCRDTFGDRFYHTFIHTNNNKTRSFKHEREKIYLYSIYKYITGCRRSVTG